MDIIFGADFEMEPTTKEAEMVEYRSKSLRKEWDSIRKKGFWVGTTDITTFRNTGKKDGLRNIAELDFVRAVFVLDQRSHSSSLPGIGTL